MSKTRKTNPVKAMESRRRFLKAGAASVAGAATLAMPQVARAQEAVVFKFQSTWPSEGHLP